MQILECLLNCLVNNFQLFDFDFLIIFFKTSADIIENITFCNACSIVAQFIFKYTQLIQLGIIIFIISTFQISKALNIEKRG